MGLLGTKRKKIRKVMLHEGDLEQLFMGEIVCGESTRSGDITQVALEDIGWGPMYLALLWAAKAHGVDLEAEREKVLLGSRG